jgi:hypothetical protein
MIGVCLLERAFINRDAIIYKLQRKKHFNKMHKKVFYLIIIIAVITFLLFGGAVWADIPAPPVNQQVGFDDGVFDNLVEADCRLCHDDPSVVGPTPNVERHHLLHGLPLPQGECSVNANACLSDSDCDLSICSSTGATCTDDDDCPDYNFGETCGEVCMGETVVPNIDTDQDGIPDTTYGCLSCHEQDTSGGVITFLVERDCLVCHVQATGEGSIHHLTATAQGIDSPLGNPDIGDCTPCHGTLVDDIGDGHAIPTYDPSLMTPFPSGGDGEPLNIRGKGAGACDYCHDWGTDSYTNVQVFTNVDTHHKTGVFLSETGVINTDTCLWCHQVIPPTPSEYDIRTCEGCHGYESLHSIAVDSDTGCLFADPTDPDCEVIVGGEEPGYSHVGNDIDCWGCHGFTDSFAKTSGTSSSSSGRPVTPYIKNSDVRVITAGTDTTVTLTGSAFTNLVGTFQWTSDVVLTDVNDSSLILIPESISQGSLKVTIPGTMPVGNYTMQALKGDDAASNPVVISVKPEVVITDVKYCRLLGILFITGSGFGEKPEGTDDYINVMKGDRMLNILFWTDVAILAFGARCGETVTVNALFGSATYDVRGGKSRGK